MYQSGKLGWLSVNTPEHYRDSVKPHVGIIAEVDLSKHKEKVLNAHGILWTIIFAAGQSSVTKTELKMI